MIKEHDLAVLGTAVPDEGLVVGDVGTIVHIYRDGQAFEVEFTTLEASQVRPIGQREISLARELTPR